MAPGGCTRFVSIREDEDVRHGLPSEGDGAYRTFEFLVSAG